jgi:Kdo2-lipid IVA lauroyltransferase/acyltransferase
VPPCAHCDYRPGSCVAADDARSERFADAAAPFPPGRLRVEVRKDTLKQWQPSSPNVVRGAVLAVCRSVALQSPRGAPAASAVSPQRRARCDPRFGLAVAALRTLARQPFALRWRCARALAWMHRHGDPVFNEVLCRNLQLCLPTLDGAALTRLADENAVETCFAQIDQFRCWQLPAAQLRAEVALEGVEHLKAVRGRPTVLVCPHFLGMEAGMQRLALEIRTVALYRPSAHPGFEALRSAARRRFNDQILVAADAPMLPVMRQLAAGTPLFLLPDLDPASAGHKFVPFFGIAAATTRTVAWCADRLGATVLPFTVCRLRADRFRATVHPPLAARWCDHVDALTTINRFIEQRIAEMPAQYWWAHPRFATRPAGARPLYSDVVLQSLRSAQQRAMPADDRCA